MKFRPRVLVLALCLLLGGCQGAVLLVQHHGAELAAVGLVAATLSQVEGAAVNALELERRLSRTEGVDERAK